MSRALALADIDLTPADDAVSISIQPCARLAIQKPSGMHLTMGRTQRAAPQAKLDRNFNFNPPA